MELSGKTEPVADVDSIRPEWRRPEDVPPERLLDVIDALLAPYVGPNTTITRDHRRCRGDFLGQLHYALVRGRLETLLVNHGIPQDLARLFSTYNTNRTAEECAREADSAGPQGDHWRYYSYLNAVVNSVASGNTELADHYLECATGVMQRYDDEECKRTWGAELDSINANRVKISRVFGEIKAEHMSNCELFARIVGDEAARDI